MAEAERWKQGGEGTEGVLGSPRGIASLPTANAYLEKQSHRRH